MRLWSLADRLEGGQSCPKIISDIVPPHISTHHAYRCLGILEAGLCGRPTNLEKNGFGLCSPLPCFFHPPRHEFISPISKGSSNSALRVFPIDAFSHRVALFQLLGASRVWQGCGWGGLRCSWGQVLCVESATFSATLAHGSLIGRKCLGWRATGSENQNEDNTKQCVSQ